MTEEKNDHAQEEKNIENTINETEKKENNGSSQNVKNETEDNSYKDIKDIEKLKKLLIEKDKKIKDTKEEIQKKDTLLDEANKNLEATKKQAEEYKDLLQRVRAEAENMRKRSIKEYEYIKKTANKELLTKFLDFIDNFDRAMNVEINSEEKPFYDGIKLIHKQILDFIESYGIKELECLNKEFDPGMHEAMMMEENGKHKMPTVVEVFQKGYILNDEILRAAKVKVVKPKEENINKDKSDEEKSSDKVEEKKETNADDKDNSEKNNEKEFVSENKKD